jgi:serine/threonine protein phosphatase PrpC
MVNPLQRLYKKKDTFMYSFISSSIRGSSHIKKDLPNQDAIDVGILSKEDYAVYASEGDSLIYSQKEIDQISISIADGHGDGKSIRSHIGSQVVVKQANFIIKQIVYDLKISNGIKEKEFIQFVSKNFENELPIRLINSWRNEIINHFLSNSFPDKKSEEELSNYNVLLSIYNKKIKDNLNQDEKNMIYKLYGTTLISLYINKDFIYFLQIGDGDILLVYDDYSILEPIQKDSELIGNTTYSISQDNALSFTKTRFFLNDSRHPSLIILSTDGYSNAFSNDEEFLKIGKDYLDRLKENDIIVRENIKNWLKKASEFSGDDISIALLYNKGVKEK